MMMKKYAVILLLFLVTTSFGQRIRLVSPTDIPGMEVTRYDTFAGSNLSKYMGNRADLFYEYGFKQICVCEYSYNGDNALAEICIMEDAPSAFGVFSVLSANCRVRNLYATFSCLNAKQVSIAYGPFYVNVVNLSSTASGQQFCEQIVQTLMSKNPQDAWYLPPLLQQASLGPYLNSLKYIEGPVGCSYSAPSLTGVLDDLNYKFYVVSLTSPANSGILVGLAFPDGSSVGSFLVRAGLSTDNTAPTLSPAGTYRSWSAINETTLIYLESTSSDLKISDLLPERVNFFDYR
jgi:hypothetical protein